MADRILMSGIADPTIFRQRNYRDFSFDIAAAANPIKTFDDIVDATKLNGNTGNLLIGEGAAAAFEGAEIVCLPPWYLAGVTQDKERLQVLRERFDRYVHVTANMIRSDYSADFEADLIENLNIPTLLIGAGIQTKNDIDNIPVGTKRFVQLLAERGHWVFTRGRDSFDFFKAKGVENVVATGCPSLYLKPESMVAALSAMNQISLNEIRQAMLGGYLGLDHKAISDARFLQSLGSEVNYILQDEHLFYGLKFSSAHEEIYDQTSGKIEASYQGSELSSICNLPTPYVFFDTVSWRHFASTQQLYFGRRFHGGIISMQVGVPAVFLLIDDRMQEMLDFIGFPSISADHFDSQDNKMGFLTKWIKSLDNNALVEKYKMREEAFRAAVAGL